MVLYSIMKRVFLPSIAVAVVIYFLSGCSLFQRPVVSVPTEEGPYGCERPTDVVLSPTELELVSLEIGPFTLGKMDYKNKPQVFELITKASRDDLIREYLACIALNRGDVDKNDPEQVDYLKRMLFIMGSDMSDEQKMKWLDDHPFPAAPSLTKTEKLFLAMGYQSMHHQLPDEETVLIIQRYFDELDTMPSEPRIVLSMTSHQSLIAQGLIEDSPIKQGETYSKINFSIKITPKGEKVFLYLVRNGKL